MDHLLRPNDDFFLQLREQHITAGLQTPPEEPYQYTPLNSDGKKRQIRLVKLLPDDVKSHLIFCEIHQVVLSDSVEYEALSYTWGDKPKDRWIVVETEDGYRRLDVSENLYSALWRLRHDFEPRFIWVDALCINQQDMAERTSQVQIMREIYASSVGVVIWLGEKSEHSEEALDLVHKINEVKDDDAARGISRNLMSNTPGDDALPSAYRRVWYDFFDLLKRPWFKRAWIVQELATAPKVTIVCGSRQMPWTEFHSAVSYMFEIGGVELAPLGLAIRQVQLFTNLDQIRRNFQDGKQFTTLEIFLYNGHALASDRRDRIFAFHGLLPLDSPDSTITEPKYTMDSPKKGIESPEFIQECIELYTERAKMLLEHHHNLDLLSITSVKRKFSSLHTRGLPTWVPDWSTPTEGAECFLWRNFLSDFRSDQRPKYRASGDSSYTPCFAGRKLLLKGRAIDRVSMVSEVVIPSPDGLDGRGLSFGFKLMRHSLRCQRALHSCEAVGGFLEGYLSNERYHTGEDLRAVYWQTLLGGLDGFAEETVSKLEASGDPKTLAQLANCKRLKDCASLQDRENSPEYKFAETLFYLWLIGGLHKRIAATLRLDWTPLLLLTVGLQGLFRFLRLLFFNWPSPGKDAILSNAFQSSASRMAHRRIVRTEGGYIGLAAPLTSPGDTVVLCKGGKLPLILRESGQDWELIGECYLHGVMDGKKWNELEREREVKGDDMSSFWII